MDNQPNESKKHWVNDLLIRSVGIALLYAGGSVIISRFQFLLLYVGSVVIGTAMLTFSIIEEKNRKR